MPSFLGSYYHTKQIKMRRLLVEDLEAIIRSREAKVSVIGQGYIGLPTSLLIAKAGFSVYGYDINQNLIRDLSVGKTKLAKERGITNLISELRGKNYIPTSNLKDLLGSDVIIIAVPTPKGRERPDISMVLEALENALESIKPGGLIVIESTLPPRTFYDIIIPRVEEHDLRVGRDVFLAYCPERALPGDLLHELTNNFRIIGAADVRSGQLAKLLYSSFVKADIEITDPLTAEIVKLVENSYRDVNIAFANEVARICEVLGLDVREVRRLANKHPRVHMLVPGIGVGGSCLTKDPLFLFWISKESGYSPNLIKNARDINSEMPYHYARVLDNVIRRITGGSTGIIAILGATYKGDVPDTRESPVEPFVRELIKRGHIVKVYDPLAKTSFGGIYVSDMMEAIKYSDVIAFVTDHSEFRFLDLNKLRKSINKKQVVLFDGRLLFDPLEAEKAGFIYISVGRSLRRLEERMVRLSRNS